MSTQPQDSPESDLRQRNLLDASLGVFLRYGFRKSSMEEVARAAQISRQGLYLHFKTKEELFRATVRHFLASTLQDAEQRLGNHALPLGERLSGAFDAVVGRFVGMLGGDADDLAEASSALVAGLIAEYEQSFIELVAKALRSEGLMTAYKATGLSAKQLAETLFATARGLKYSARTQAEFGERMDVAIRMLCAPLAPARAGRAKSAR